MSKKYKVTQSGLQKIQKEYEQLKNIDRPKAVKRLQIARSLGDLRENSEYHTAKEELSEIDSRIRYLQEVLENVELIDEKSNSSIVQIGDTVELLDENNTTMTITLVGDFEADPINNKFSANSPLGQAIINRSLNDKVTVNTPAGKKTYTIKNITRD
ncbi:MAG: transcription elongation factor GreA [Patescibacteria group bacterium]|nr:MAG: transcription elongation factor GreA [Patescibacteria group bacterium]